ncbi:MAG: DUF2380 domain-containing protein [Methylobacter sp.]|nr:DUF2380 domain-containing protein [Methylobacter sp.]
MKAVLMIFLWSLLIGQVNAETRIALLDFELRDLTLAPGIPSELQRTAGIKPMLETELKRAGYSIIPVDTKAYLIANGGVGYLFDHNDSAAELGKNAGADYILVGRLHKPSFLFAYLMGHLIRTRDGQVLGNYISETKGSDKKLTLKAVESITVKIDNDLDRRYTPPPPAKVQ